MHVMAWIHVRMYVCMCACNELLHVLLLAVCGCCLRCASVCECCALTSAGEKGEQGIDGVPGRKGMPVGHVTVM